MTTRMSARVPIALLAGLAILVTLFRNLKSIDVEDLGSLKG